MDVLARPWARLGQKIIDPTAPVQKIEHAAHRVGVVSSPVPRRPVRSLRPLTGRTADGAAISAPPGRAVLLDNLVAHLADPAIPLLAPLAACGPFMHLLEAVRRDGPARPLPSRRSRADRSALKTRDR